ncbi:hypothetical protein phiMK_61 [Pseudomonas phage phiMK]|uniref:Uncharacterized protein n=3 Tax=Pakpunavirus TaxID=1921407 RepID=V5JWP4_9CAUD|nr:hypothetical protein X831_gp064 [Pseudomonas phage PAK_P2]YP_009291129.1 hypothetical protein BI047_gp129 [Pseudomonas phage phiMK]YP_010765363.1 hypothetical protein QE348_gp067 [Pseudomonas phage vB_Paer_PsIn]AGR89184.1 hypothetical protein PAK_P200063 [Pseudomonas phage PAK_P2]AMQ66249.1 hypothetical protein phiMK_61 [Pseudomonas phage phiMK]UOL48095.1 hypothetical protein vBPaerPsIn_67 [Pseudomonas phage vB_Paer_PsIn]
MNEDRVYIAVRDDAPEYMVPTLVAHSILGADRNAQQRYRAPRFPPLDEQVEAEDMFTRKWIAWLEESFRKVVVRVSDKEYNKIKRIPFVYEGYEKTICNGEGSCLVVPPLSKEETPNVLKFAKLWRPM